MNSNPYTSARLAAKLIELSRLTGRTGVTLNASDLDMSMSMVHALHRVGIGWANAYLAASCLVEWLEDTHGVRSFGATFRSFRDLATLVNMHLTRTRPPSADQPGLDPETAFIQRLGHDTHNLL